MPFARKPPTPEAIAFEAWKIPIRSARSEGLYQKLKYITTMSSSAHALVHGVSNMDILHAGTTPLSGRPRKNLVAKRPAAFCTAPMHIAMPPNPSMMNGKKNFPEYFFIRRLDGMRNAVTMKYVIDMAQLNCMPWRLRSVRIFCGVSAWSTPA